MPVTHNVMRLLARYSEGWRLAVEYGPTSGVVFEYAYQNRPQGNGALGRWIDRTFLRLSTWDSIRQRVQATKSVVADLVARRRAAGQSTLILDVASGTARYLRELYLRYGDWLLALAAYNAGEKKVSAAIERAGTRDFWQLAQRGWLPLETRRYVSAVMGWTGQN